MRAVVVEQPGSITVTSVKDPTPQSREVVLAIDGVRHLRDRHPSHRR